MMAQESGRNDESGDAKYKPPIQYSSLLAYPVKFAKNSTCRNLPRHHDTNASACRLAGRVSPSILFVSEVNMPSAVCFQTTGLAVEYVRTSLCERSYSDHVSSTRAQDTSVIEDTYQDQGLGPSSDDRAPN